MRKFTKEIAALLAAVSVSASANMATTNTENEKSAMNALAASKDGTSVATTAGVMVTTRVGTEVSSAATTTKVTLPPEDGVAMPPDEYTTTTRATTTTTIGTQTSKLTTTTTTVPANDNIELPLEEIEIGGGKFTDDNIYGEYAAFYAQGAEYVILQYSVVGNCDEFEGVFMTAVDGELVEEPFTASVKNGVAKISYHVPFNSDDYITAVVFNPEDKGIALENVELVNLESRTTTSIPPLMGTIAATTETTTIPPLAGEPLPPDEYTTTTTIPPLMGTQTIPTSTTTQTYIAGGMMPSDEETTTTTTTIPPLEGTQMPTTEPETFPPLLGVMPYIIGGDANNDSAVSIADAAAILQYIANPDKYGLSEKGMLAADVVGNGNGITVDDAIAIQKLDAKIIDDFSELE